MIRRGPRALALASLLAWLCAAQGPDAGQVRQQLQEVQGRLRQVDGQLEALKKRRRGLLVDLQGISLQRDRARMEAEGAHLRRDEAQAEVVRISQERVKLKGELERLRGDLRRQARWMQALGPLGDTGLLGSEQEAALDLRKGRYLAYVRLQERKRLGQVRELQVGLDTREKALQDVLARLAREEQDLAQLQAGLRLNEEKLESFLEGLQKDEGKQKALQAELAEEALQLERMLASLLGKQPKSESFETPTAFASLRGELPSPVDGTLAESFGEHQHPKYHTRTVQNGVLIEAAAGSPVQAVADGRVVFADVYQSYGPMVILDHGHGWFTLYTHLQVLRVAKGQVLRQGDLLGAVGETLDGPRLGFEIRQQAKPEDPNKWLKRRYR